MRSHPRLWCVSAVLAAALTTVGCSETTEPAATAPMTPPAASTTTTPPEPTPPVATEPAPANDMDKDKDKGKEKAGAGAGQGDMPKIEPPAKEKEGAAAAAGKLTDDELAAIKKLPADEQVLALRQKVCPISDEHLGAMDKPVKVTLEGKTVFLCCAGCKKEAEADPKATLAKLNAGSK